MEAKLDDIAFMVQSLLPKDTLKLRPAVPSDLPTLSRMPSV